MSVNRGEDVVLVYYYYYYYYYIPIYIAPKALASKALAAG